ncbi:MAG: hypothetical protein CR975_01775 [Gammaproteobacteria bacterium]|nr:MAG: hypothetical protein CR975_01775 [Gammaproteobacteria bacterium]
MPQEYRHPAPNGLPNYSPRGYLLYILPAPLFIKLVLNLISPDLRKLLLTAAALLCFYSAAHLTRTTLLRLQNQVPHRPKKIKDNRTLAALYVSLGVLILMLMMRRPPLLWAVMGASAFIGYYLLYGLSEKYVEPQDKYDKMPKATREAVKTAYQDLQHIEALGRQLDTPIDKALFNHLEKVIEQSYVIMDLLVKAPEDAGRARRFLNVYINRIKEILQQYLKLSQHGKADKLRERLGKTLSEVEHAFRVKKAQLLDDDIFQLDIQLEVLDEQIKQEK